MEVLHERCAGLDVHKKSVVACLLTPGPSGQAHKQLRTFGTMTGQVQDLCAWLEAAGCTHAAMESTGIYWRPIYNLLEGHFDLTVANAQHIKAVPGRKTDVRDAEWIAQLLRHGLLRASFVPDQAQWALRELTRHRSKLLAERTRAVNRLQRVLEDGNIKLSSVISDVLGRSGRDMLEGLLAEDPDPEVLARLAQPELRATPAQLVAALSGHLRDYHRFLLGELLGHIDELNSALERLNREIAARLRAHEGQIKRLDTIPGVNRRVAEVLLAEFGLAIEHFPDAEHLASWAGMCPGNNESAGRQKSGRTRQGDRWLKQILAEAANGAGKSKGTYLGAQYGRLRARRGAQKAVIAVGHSILVIAYHLLTREETYEELGEDYFARRNVEGTKRRAIRELERLGLKVSVEEAVATS